MKYETIEIHSDPIKEIEIRELEDGRIAIRLLQDKQAVGLAYSMPREDAHKFALNLLNILKAKAPSE